MLPNTVSQQAIELIKAFEGYHNPRPDGTVSAYRCPAGKWTIGWGTTKGVTSGLNITREEAERRLAEDLQDALAGVRRHVRVPLSQYQSDALVSFVHNVGEGNFSRSTLVTKLNRGEYDAVPTELARWNKARVKGELTVLPGLVRRRAAEAALFTMDTPLASDSRDLMPQKVEQEAEKPLSQSRTIGGAGVAGVSTVLAVGAEQMQGVIPYSDIAGYIFVALTLIGVAVAIYARWDDHKEGRR
jgi:lysozyme